MLCKGIHRRGGYESLDSSNLGILDMYKELRGYTASTRRGVRRHRIAVNESRRKRQDETMRLGTCEAHFGQIMNFMQGSALRWLNRANH